MGIFSGGKAGGVVDPVEVKYRYIDIHVHIPEGAGVRDGFQILDPRVTRGYQSDARPWHGSVHFTVEDALAAADGDECIPRPVKLMQDANGDYWLARFEKRVVVGGGE